ncbi:MAG: PocR ligand-binding domain-containing protein [Sedimentisphaerales bacterium]|nr:PocR ligand-binding domain-containing protein [Sedimentisphaerales bacterium]
MNDEEKTREQLLDEIRHLRQINRELHKCINPDHKECIPDNESRTDNPCFPEGKYSIRDMVDMDQLQSIFEQFSLATGLPAALVEYPSQDILIGTGWNEICTDFHRKNPETLKHCIQSNISLTQELKEPKVINIRYCENGLVDGATPIVIMGRHVANLFIGQIFFDPPDIERFTSQAQTYNFDEEAYLEALGKVTLVSREQFTQALNLLSEIAEIIAELGLHNLHMTETARRLHREIRERKMIQLEKERLIAELEEKNAELQRFTYTVSHDLKGPLITIKGFLGLLEQDALEHNLEQLKTDITHINNATTKMHQLLDELLELSRIGRIVNQPQNVNLCELTREVIYLFDSKLREKGVHVEIMETIPLVQCDAPRIRQVMQNLIENAIKYMGHQPDPRIEIGFRDGNEGTDEPVFYVRDNGIGIEPQFHNKVFSLFCKLDNTMDGSGVGLTIVQRIIELHGGKIWIESGGSGKGTTFCFTLPRQIEPVQQ